MFNVAVSCLAITAMLAYFNRRFIRLPTTIGVMAIALAISAILVVLDLLGFGHLRAYEAELLSSIDFSKVLMQGMLSLLLFAGALHVNLSEMRRYRWQIAALTICGTLASTLIVATATWWLLPLVGLDLAFPYCFIFGALISPTDPVAVIGILKSAGAPKNVSVVITGESLFNDGVAIVLFALGVSMLKDGEMPGIHDSLFLLAKDAGGGILFGLVLGMLMYWMLKSMDSYQEEIMITLAGVMGGYALATEMHVSGPLAMVIAGLIIGNHARASVMSDQTREHLDMFWDLIDSMLNAVLFVLTGMSIVMIKFDNLILGAGVAITVALVARYLSTGLPMAMMGKHFRLPRGSWKVLTWGGLRGGISVALALSLPSGQGRDQILALTYAIVVFSILVQGLTIGPLIKRVFK
jgi:CPA1 family monovalent cation:H+ antiporter